MRAFTASHPARWVPSLYFAMGLSLTAVTLLSAVLCKNLGLGNAEVAFYTGSLYLPWVIKPLWSPLVEMFRTRRFFVLATQLAMAVTFGAVALALPLPRPVAWTIALFWIVGFAAATQDLAADGVYIAALDRRAQAAYVGVQGIFWNLGRIAAAGGLVSLTGVLRERMGLDWVHAWSAAMAVLGLLMAMAWGWHARVLPAGERAAEGPRGAGGGGRRFAEAFRAFFSKPRMGSMLALAYFFRFGEGLIEKMGPLFLLDARAAGGLGLDNVQLGTINGLYGTTAFVVGALVAGAIASRVGLRRALFVLAVALNLPHASYVYLSHAQPESVVAIGAAVALEKLGYGLGSVGHMLYMMQQMAPGPFKTSHYALSTGVMGLCMMSTGMISGLLADALGYRLFFIGVVALSAVPLALAWRAPFPVSDAEDRPAA